MSFNPSLRARVRRLEALTGSRASTIVGVVIRPGTTPDEARARIAAAQVAAGLVYVANLARLRAHPENA